MSKKRKKSNNPDIYGELVDFQDKLHAQNLKRIRIGLLCVLIIPMVFLALMFITDSNKVIWLILWIVSLFAISAYLIVVEYGDYNLQHRINSITGNDAEPIPLLESGINGANEKLASVKAEAQDILASARESINIDEKKEAAHGSKSSDIYSAGIDTDIIEESLFDNYDSLDDEAAGKADPKNGRKKKKSGKDKSASEKKHKKDKKKKNKKKDKKKKSDKKKKKNTVKEENFDE